MSLPTVTGVGTLTHEPELRFTQSGKAVATVNIACNARRYNKETQTWEDGDATYLRGTIWSDAAENVAESLEKGARVVFSGTLRQNSWEDKEGNKRSSLELLVDEIGPSLKWATAKVSKAGKKAAGDPWAGNDEPAW